MPSPVDQHCPVDCTWKREWRSCVNPVGTVWYMHPAVWISWSTHSPSFQNGTSRPVDGNRWWSLCGGDCVSSFCARNQSLAVISKYSLICGSDCVFSCVCITLIFECIHWHNYFKYVCEFDCLFDCGAVLTTKHCSGHFIICSAED